MATREEIIKEIEALAEHYIRPVRPPDAYQRWLKDYLEDLKAYPLESIQHGCKQWRQSDAVKFPTIGQLSSFVRRTVRTTEPTMNEAWKPLSDADYEKLTLAEKIRHRKIMATRAVHAAGPQCINGVPVPPADMPERWHDLKARAHAHIEEARRLQNILNNAQADRQLPSVS